MAVDIRHIPFEDIDTLRWNSCIHFANNGNVFAYYWYIKNVVRSFDALVEGEYESVMPLISSTNLAGQPVLHHPDILGRLGIFSVHVLSSKRLQAFIDAIPHEFKESRILFNELNPIRSHESVTSVPWYLMNLDQPYENIERNYSVTARRYLDKAKSLDLMPDGNIKPEKLMGFFKEQNPGIDQHAWMRVHYNLMHRGTAFPTTYRDRNGKIYAAGLFAYSNGFISNLFYTARKNYESSLFYLMMDDIIRVHAGRSITLDFNRCNQKELDPKELGAISKHVYDWNVRSRWGKITDWLTPW